MSSTTTKVDAEALLSIFTRVGFPRDILNDNGLQFLSGVMKEVAQLMYIHQVHYSPYHPMANGLVERFNGTLKKMLVSMCADWEIGTVVLNLCSLSTVKLRKILLTFLVSNAFTVELSGVRWQS